MKKYILIFSLIMLKFNLLNSQTIGTYLLSNNNYGVIIHLFDTNKYIISITILSSIDDISSYDLSYGTFKTIEKKIILKDKINDSKIFLLMESNDLQDDLLTDKGLACFDDKPFIYMNNLSSLSDTYKKLDSIANLNYKEIIHKNEVGNINIGEYSDNGEYIEKGRFSDKGRYEINIKSNYKYEYKIDNVIISKGNYSINGNTLIFYDEYLRYNFKAEINKGIITNSNLPGYFINLKYYKTSK